MFRTAAGEPLSTDEITSRVIVAKGLDVSDVILRAAIRGQVGSPVKRSRREGTIENIGTGRTRPHVRLGTGRPVSQYAGNEGCAGLAGAEPHA